jgi:hypothetical protein
VNCLSLRISGRTLPIDSLSMNSETGSDRLYALSTPNIPGMITP